MKSHNLFLSFLILLTLSVPAAVIASDQNSNAQKDQWPIREVIYDILLLYGDNGNSGNGNGQGGVVVTDGGAGGGGNTTGGGGENGGSTISPNVLNFISPTGQSFSLTKLNSQGQALAASAGSWSCLKDNLNNLVWEVKTTDGGLHDQSDTFSWYDPNQINLAKVGIAENSGASCEGYVAGDPSTYCNTQAYVARVNTNGLCGQQGWRVPNIDELKSLVSMKSAAQDVYSSIFPKGIEKAVWTASTIASYPAFAWHIYLNDGYAHGNDKSGNLPVLLVRNAQP